MPRLQRPSPYPLQNQRSSCAVALNRREGWQTFFEPYFGQSSTRLPSRLRITNLGPRTKIPVAFTRFFDSLLGLSGESGKRNGPWSSSCEGGSSSAADAAKEEAIITLKTIPCSAGCSGKNEAAVCDRRTNQSSNQRKLL